MTAGKRTAHQSRFGQSYCVPCDPGLYAAEAGAAVCSPCQRGSFVNSSTATRCFSCGQEEVWTTSKAVQVGEQERWIEVKGASSESSCRCVQGRYLSEGQCEICPLGSSCPGSGNLTLLPGFYSTESQPGAVLECFFGIRFGVQVARRGLVQLEGTQRVLLAVLAFRAYSRTMLGNVFSAQVEIMLRFSRWPWLSCLGLRFYTSRWHSWTGQVAPITVPC